jgi:hypothetical protein
MQKLRLTVLRDLYLVQCGTVHKNKKVVEYRCELVVSRGDKTDTYNSGHAARAACVGSASLWHHIQ